jgi:AcrR family transcriptional regulator
LDALLTNGIDSIINTDGRYLLEKNEMTAKRPKAERMSGIVQAALDEFLAKGYENSSMESIAARAGLSKGGLYHHFASKDEILLFVNEKLSEPVAAILARAERQSSALLGLRTYIQGYLKHWLRRPQQLVFFFLSMTRVLADAGLWAMWEQYAEQMIGAFQALLTKGIENGEFLPHDTRARAIALMSALDGVAGYLIIDRHLKFADVCRGLEDVLIGPLLNRSAESNPGGRS